MTKILQCISPVDGSVYVERETLGPESAALAVEKAAKAGCGWASVPLEERIELVLQGVELVGAANSDIVPELAWQMGRPVRYGGEFGGFRERAEYMAGIAADALQPAVIEDSPRFQRRIVREPCGTVLVIAPWNYPYMTAINTVAPALIAGNSVVLKHATQTMLVGERIADAFHESGVPEDVFQNLVMDHETTLELIGSGAFGFVNFTGSVGAGRAIEMAAAGTFTGVGLELGGKDPGYVMEDADPETAAEVLIDGAMYNSGQCCCGIERIYVSSRLFDRFLEKSLDIVNGYVLGNPLEEETTLGPMAQRRFADEVRAQVDEALDSGATAHLPDFEGDDGGTYLSPQVLTGVDHEMRVMRDESFGPVVGIMAVESDDEAIALMNDSEFGLTASLWTGEPERAAGIGNRIETGTVFMNRCDYLDPGLCWTGRKNTGRGGVLSHIGYQNLTRPKSFHMKFG